MKRVKAACIEQIIQFQAKDEANPETALRIAQEEYETYKKHLEYRKTKYKILAKNTLPDGSVQIRIKKQYNNSPVGDMLN